MLRHISSARTEQNTQQNVVLMAAALTWCKNIFVRCTVTPTFFFGRSLPFLILSIITKKILYLGSFNYFAFTIHMESNTGVRDLDVALVNEGMALVAKIC